MGSKITYKHGQKIGSCIYLNEQQRRTNSYLRRRAKFRCKCGKEFIATIEDVKSGHTKSCGCFINSKTLSHGYCRRGANIPPEYQVWVAMKYRCLNENEPSYKDYGGRGITVCKRWLHSFENFISDMGFRPSPKHSLDRIDNDGNYKPSNCRWATNAEQMSNRRNTKIITFNGETMGIDGWAERLGLSYNALHDRLFVKKWTLDRALTEYRNNNGTPQLLTFNNKTLPIKEWAKKIGIYPSTIRRRLKRGWTLKMALTNPKISLNERRRSRKKKGDNAPV